MSLILHGGGPQPPRESVAEASNVEPTILEENRRDLANAIRICRSLICLYKFNLLLSFRGMACPRLLYSMPKIVAKWSELYRMTVSLYLDFDETEEAPRPTNILIAVKQCRKVLRLMLGVERTHALGEDRPRVRKVTKRWIIVCTRVVAELRAEARERAALKRSRAR